MIDERLEDAYKKEIEQLKRMLDKLTEEKHYGEEKRACMAAELKQAEIEVERLRAQMEVVRLIFGGTNK